MKCHPIQEAGLPKCGFSEALAKERDQGDHYRAWMASHGQVWLIHDTDDPTKTYQTSLFVSVPQFFLVYEATKRAFDKTDYIRLVDQMISTPLLILDDVDKSRATETRWEIYWEIFDERYRAKRPTILSTNKREELDHHIGEACLSRLSRGLMAVEMKGDDYRREERV